MFRWPFSFSSFLNNKDDRDPWNAAIIPYLELKQVFSIIPILPPGKAKYSDPPEISFLVQFTRLKLFLDAKLLDENGRVWKLLQEADPGFKKIRHLYHFAVYCSDVKPDGFPEEWKDKSYFANWLFVNIFTQLQILDWGTLQRGTGVILHTDYVKKWKDEKQKYEDSLEKQKREIEKMEQKQKDKLEKDRLALEKKQKKWEVKLAKDVEQLSLPIHRRLDELSRENVKSFEAERHAADQISHWDNIWTELSKDLDPDDATKDKVRLERIKNVYEEAQKWRATRKEEEKKQQEHQREYRELMKKLTYYQSLVLESGKASS